MKLDRELAEKLRIPVWGMKPFDIVRHQKRLMGTGLFDELKRTQGFRGNVILQSSRSVQTVAVYFVQREDGQIFFGCLPSGLIHFDNIKCYLDPNIAAELIVCDVPAVEVSRSWQGYLHPEYGALAFLGDFHPSHSARVAAWLRLAEMFPPELSSEQRAAMVREAVFKLGVLGVGYEKTYP
tara:strand:- start:7317 stop:7859 length:543 start_codon:yes stop_codon:yes gene_type:complete